MKRLFDLTAALIGLLALSMLLMVLWIVVRIKHGSPVLFCQQRPGLHGRPFTMHKFRTMTGELDVEENLLPDAQRLTGFGKFLRSTSLDELPTLYNVLKGDMSLVGPRPDVPGYADKLKGSDRRILELRPGITGPATLKYANEEQLLVSIDDPEKYNDEVIYSDKVKMNLDYLDNRNSWLDIKIIFKTIFRSNY